jgi:hypothetical protein
MAPHSVIFLALFQSTDTLPAKVVKVRLSNFSVADSLNFGTGRGNLNAGFASGDYAYFG